MSDIWSRLRDLSYLLMAVALVLVGISLVRTGAPLEDRLTSTVWFLAIVALAGLSLLSARVTRNARRAGRWEERMEMRAAMSEAAERGMSAEEFLTGYAEKMQAEFHEDFAGR